jgi:hypothetical protein
MSVVKIEAVIACDGCGRELRLELDPANKPPSGWALFDCAEDAVRGSVGAMAGPNSSSVQGGLMLCGICTRKIDDAIPEDRNATRSEAAAILARE